MTARHRTRVLALAGLAAALSACAESDVPSPVVLVSLDTLRADRLSCYGHDRPTPAIDALAADGIRYARAQAPATWTLPSHTSIFTGRYPSTHAVQDTWDKLAPDVPTIAEALQRRGYRTAGFISHVSIDESFGLARGFETYELNQYKNFGEDVVRGDVTVAAATDWLEENAASGDPYFLFVHLFDPHWPYAAPAPFGGKYSEGYEGSLDGNIDSLLPYTDARVRDMDPADLQHILDLYDEEIAYADSLVARLVERVRSLPGGDRAVVILTSDHGEEFREHGSIGHGYTLYDEQTHVPLIVANPADRHAGAVVEAPLSTLDLALTIAHVAGVPETDPFYAGADGEPLPLAEPEGGSRPVRVETTLGGPYRSATIRGDRKAISAMVYQWNHGTTDGKDGPARPTVWQRGLELFDLAEDPAEQAPLDLEGYDSTVASQYDWEERVWRGVVFELRVQKGWEGAFILPEGARCFDEPRIDNSRKVLRYLPWVGRIVLKNLPLGQLRLHLPLDPDAVGSVSVECTRGDLWLNTEQGLVEIAEGETRVLDLTVASYGKFAPPPRSDRSGAVLRIRPLTQRRDVRVMDEQTSDALRSLGYVR